jgi:hypothetical protein
MTAPSYAKAASSGMTMGTVGAGTVGSSSPMAARAAAKADVSFELQLRELSQPNPRSMTLTATLHLLAPLNNTEMDVFLMTRSYVQNWLIWAYHQKVPKVEASRVEAAVRLAAARLGLTPPTLDMEHTDPGPIDVASKLSLEGHPLLLLPNVEVVDGKTKQQDAAALAALHVPDSLRRVKSLPVENNNDNNNDKPEQDNALGDDLDENGFGQITCCAVPEQFYEVRSL